METRRWWGRRRPWRLWEGREDAMFTKSIIASVIGYGSQNGEVELNCEKGFDTMEEIGGLLNSQFGIFIGVWIRHLGSVWLLDWISGPGTYVEWQNCGQTTGQLRTNCTADFG